MRGGAIGRRHTKEKEGLGKEERETRGKTEKKGEKDKDRRE